MINATMANGIEFLSVLILFFGLKGAAMLRGWPSNMGIFMTIVWTVGTYVFRSLVQIGLFDEFGALHDALSFFLVDWLTFTVALWFMYKRDRLQLQADTRLWLAAMPPAINLLLVNLLIGGSFAVIEVLAYLAVVGQLAYLCKRKRMLTGTGEAWAWAIFPPTSFLLLGAQLIHHYPLVEEITPASAAGLIFLLAYGVMLFLLVVLKARHILPLRPVSLLATAVVVPLIVTVICARMLLGFDHLTRLA